MQRWQKWSPLSLCWRYGPNSTATQRAEKQKYGINWCVLKTSAAAGSGWRTAEVRLPAGSLLPVLHFPLPPSIPHQLPCYSPGPEPTECLQTAEQGGKGRTGRDVGPRQQGRGSAQGQQDSHFRQRGRDSCCGGGGLEWEKWPGNSLGLHPRFPRKLSLESARERETKVCGAQTEITAAMGTVPPRLPSTPSTIPVPLQQDRGTGLCVRLREASAEGWSASQRCTASLVLELKKEAAPKGTAPIPEQRWQGCSAPEWVCGQRSELMAVWAVLALQASAGCLGRGMQWSRQTSKAPQNPVSLNTQHSHLLPITRSALSSPATVQQPRARGAAALLPS